MLAGGEAEHETSNQEPGAPHSLDQSQQLQRAGLVQRLADLEAQEERLQVAVDALPCEHLS